jgi:hypothetical protein
MRQRLSHSARRASISAAWLDEPPEKQNGAECQEKGFLRKTFTFFDRWTAKQEHEMREGRGVWGNFHKMESGSEHCQLSHD